MRPKTKVPDDSASLMTLTPPDVVVLEELESVVSVPLGKVPLITMVFVPLTSPTCTSVLFSALKLPLPIRLSKYVELLLSSQPQALYISHKHSTGNVVFWSAAAAVLLDLLRKEYGWEYG